MLTPIKAIGLGLLLACPATAATFTVTAYCPCAACCGKWAGGSTASGVRPREGIAVAAPRSIPFGTRLWIQGVGWRTVQDRTARQFGDRIDVYFQRHADAKKFGIQHLTVHAQK